MRYEINPQQQYPSAEITLEQGETMRIESGSMIYHSAGITLNTKLNTTKGGVFGAMAKSLVSGESMFITEVQSSAPNQQICIAPKVPGVIIPLEIGQQSYYLNDSAFFAMDSTVQYTTQRQSIGKAIFGGQGGLFVLKTGGHGTLLVNAYGSTKIVDLQNATNFTVDNSNVVAWSTSLNYEIKLAGKGFLQSIGTGEGVVNCFSGTGRLYIQTLNLQSTASALAKYMPSKG
jgi:uncharacterized protein (TIGR00266 family)